MRSIIKADLHFHPSFTMPGHSLFPLEMKTPSIDEIAQQAIKKNIGLLAITSYSTPTFKDTRWESYLKQEVKNPWLINEEHVEQWICGYNEDLNSEFYIVHGQELAIPQGKGRAEINVLFAEKRVPIENPNYNKNLLTLIDAAKDCGDSVMVTLPHIGRGCIFSHEELRKLFESGKIDAVEWFDSLDLMKNNVKGYDFLKNLNYCTQDKQKVPGIAVSDGHRLKDMAAAYILTDLESEINKTPFRKLIREFKDKIRNKEYDTECCLLPVTSKILYVAKLANAAVLEKIAGRKG